MSNLTELHNEWQTDIVGHVDNTDLPTYKVLMPLFEAVANSIHATKANGSNAEIVIGIERENTSVDLFDEKTTPKICNVVITDNGVGFDEENYISFKTVNSRNKSAIGGKGLGRFTWLKAFESVEVDSVYKNGSDLFRRNFHFSLKSDFKHGNVLLKDTVSKKTSVKLISCKKKYQKKLPVKIETLAQKILEHHISSLLQKDAPKIILRDDSVGEEIVVNDILQNMMIDVVEKDVQLKEDNILSLKIIVLQSDDIDHTVSLCAHEREVISQSLGKYISVLKGSPIVYKGHSGCKVYTIVTGDYLDDRVNSLRTNINFDDSEDVEDMFDESAAFIYKKISGAISSVFGEQISLIERRKMEAIENFIITKEPEYRVLLKHSAKEIGEIAFNLPENKLDIELYKIKQKLELDIRENSREIFANGDGISVENAEYREKFDKFVETMQDLRQSELTKYVIHRRTMLELLNAALRKEDGKYALEEQVHKILYPMRATSDDVEFGHQNLWIIDERLAYHYHIASDIEFYKNKITTSQSADRPDILIFDKPSAFVDENDSFQSIVIIELKRPERDNFSSGTDKKTNPIAQVFSYIKEIKKGEAVDRDGVKIRVNGAIRFYCYIIADLTESMEDAAIYAGLKKTPDGLGYFGVNDIYNAYIEVIGFRKMLDDARKRNAILFEKLGIQNVHRY